MGTKKLLGKPIIEVYNFTKVKRRVTELFSILEYLSIANEELPSITTSYTIRYNQFKPTKNSKIENFVVNKLMKFKLGEGIFLQTRLNPIRSKFIQIDDYPIKIIESKYTVNQKKKKTKLFDLDKYREKYNSDKFKNENQTMDIVYDPTMMLKNNVKGE